MTGAFDIHFVSLPGGIVVNKHGVRIEEADRALARISGKENCYAAAVFEKFEDEPETGDTPISDTPPSTPNGGTPRTPVKTGDTTPIIGMSLLLMSAGITIILLINKRRRRSR